MEKLNEETQIIAVEKVLEEMKNAEEFVMKWQSSWYEQLLDAYCPPLHCYIGEADIRDMERKYAPRYKLSNAYFSGESIGVPLETEVLVGDNSLTGEYNINFECEFGRIDWYGMNSHNATRHFSFHNNGDIEFSKESKPRKSIKKQNRISYDAKFNVLLPDFDITITLSQLTNSKKERNTDILSLSLKDNILIERFNDIEIIKDLTNGTKSIRIVKKYDKKDRQNNASVAFEAMLDQQDCLEAGAIAINTHKKNGKINGTYRFDVSRKKGVRANFYSRKGIKIDLLTNPSLLNTANSILLPGPNNQNKGAIIVSDFANSTQRAITKNLSEKVISFDNTVSI